MKYVLPALIIALFIVVVGFHPKGLQKTVINDKSELTDSSRKKETIGSTATTYIATNESNAASTNETKAPSANDQSISFVEYAKTLIGTPYLYGSTNPAKGLDCSGFVNCVSNHFGIKVPRSSVDFTNFGTTVGVNDAKPGDLILFTGTNAARRIVGHMGIVTTNDNGNVQFIHSSSGKAKGVTMSELDGYYQTRFMKIVRIFPETAGKMAA